MATAHVDGMQPYYIVRTWGMESHIPRFLAHFEYVEGRSVFAMLRRDWVSFGVSAGSPVHIDVACTPMSNVAQSAFVIAATAVTLSAPADQIHIYRWDPVDPLPINPTTTSRIDNLALPRYAAPAYPTYHQEAAHVTRLSDRRRRIFHSHV